MASFWITGTRLLRMSKCYTVHQKLSVRQLTSKQLVYNEFGDPLNVVKFKECEVPPLGSTEVLVRMLAAPVNPADLNTIQGKNYCKPKLPCVPGDEGVGQVVEIGKLVGAVDIGDKVVLSKRSLGTWQYYGIYDERDLQVVTSILPLPESAMLCGAPCIAYRLLKDFIYLEPGCTVIQNAANSAVGQCVIQLCKAWNIKTFNVLTCNDNFVRNYLCDLGGDAIYTLEEAEKISCFNTTLTRPVLALNGTGGKFEDVLLQHIRKDGHIINYGDAFKIAPKHALHSNLTFDKFHLMDWENRTTSVEKSTMFKDIIQLHFTGKFRSPKFEYIELRHYLQAFENTSCYESKHVTSFIFDFTI